MDSSVSTDRPPVRGRTVAILVAAGRGERLGAGVLKPLRAVGGLTLLERSVRAFATHPSVDEIVVALPPPLAADPPACLRSPGKPVRVVAGGERRQDSVALALAAAPEDAELVVVHDAARPFVSAEVIARTLEAAREAGAALAALPARDTVKLADAPGSGLRHAATPRLVRGTLPRQTIFLAQTPQAFRRGLLRDAFAQSDARIEVTDEADLVERTGHPVRLVDGDPLNIKVTVPDDLVVAEAIARARESESRVSAADRGAAWRIGQGYDLHRLVEGRPLILGGVRVPAEHGLLGHSDADVVCHAVTDAILGAAAAGDIGRHFPDSDARFEGASSLDLLKQAVGIVHRQGYRVVNVDVTVIAERPKIAAHAEAMRANLAEALGVAADRVSVKAKTNEGVDAVGRGEAMASFAVASIEAL
jgi:2-C-methyl-D-erythritol 4-phosphate cytidylyltransferase/2-C-methyl-D-erythritol 2,4-cyclodiphosphate synthase